MHTSSLNSHNYLLNRRTYSWVFDFRAYLLVNNSWEFLTLLKEIKYERKIAETTVELR